MEVTPPNYKGVKMKDFSDFAAAIRELATGNDYSFQNNYGKLGAYGLTKRDIYFAGYSLDGYAPKGMERKTVLPKRLFIKEHFWQDKIFILHCRRLKTKIWEQLAEIMGSTFGSAGINEAGIIAGIILSKNGDCRSIREITREIEEYAGKKMSKTDLTYYIKSFSDYDLSSVK